MRTYKNKFSAAKTKRLFLALLILLAIALMMVVVTISFGQAPLPGPSDPGNEGNAYPALSLGGRYTAFESNASGLVPVDNNGVWDVFVRDNQTGDVSLVSTSAGGAQGDADSWRPDITADGRYVVFTSHATNLVPGSVSPAASIMVNDTADGAVTLASADSSGIPANFDCWQPSISDDGRYVAFESQANNLAAGYDSVWRGIYVKDMATGAVTVASTDASGLPGDQDSSHPVLNADGRYVVFESRAANLVAADDNWSQDVLRKEIQSGQVTLVSLDGTGTQGNADSYRPSVSADGRYVAFESKASNLVDDDTNGQADIFVKDMQTGTITRASTDSGGAQASGESYNPTLTTNGGHVAFTTTAQLDPADTDNLPDVYLKDLSTGSISRFSTQPVSQGVERNYVSVLSPEGGSLAYDFETTGTLDFDIFQADTQVPCTSGRPVLKLSLGSAYWATYSDYLVRALSVDYDLTNTGSDIAYAVMIMGSTANNGVTCSTTMPVAIGALGGGGMAGSGAATLKYNIPHGVGNFRVTVAAVAEDGCGNGYQYPDPGT